MAAGHDLEKLTLNNQEYRQIALTTNELQLVLMALPAGSSIPLEIHTKNSQFIRVEDGSIQVFIHKESGEIDTLTIKAGQSVTIPSNTFHEVHSTYGAKLYTVYAPPVHVVKSVPTL